MDISKECLQEATSIAGSVDIHSAGSDMDGLYKAIAEALQKRQNLYKCASKQRFRFLERKNQLEAELSRMRTYCTLTYGESHPEIKICPHEQESKEQSEKLEKAEGEIEHLQRQLEMQTYNGNSIGYIYDKMVAYRGQVLPMSNALRELGFEYRESGNSNQEREKVLMEWAVRLSEKLKTQEALLEEVGEALAYIQELAREWDMSIAEIEVVHRVSTEILTKLRTFSKKESNQRKEKGG